MHGINRSCISALYWEYSTQSTSIRYPLCLKHRVLRYAPNPIFRRHVLNLCWAAVVLWFFIYAAGLPLRAWVLRGDVIRDPNLVMISTALLTVGIAIFALARRFTPVKIDDINRDVLVISISSAEYASAFEVADADRITNKLPRRLRRGSLLMPFG